jgi:hypothetical protein
MEPSSVLRKNRPRSLAWIEPEGSFA